MKRTRFVALLLALAMVLGTTAFAAEYTVKSGDSLWGIARELLGNGAKWSEIFEANKDTVKDPNKIYVGQKLTIPGDEATEPAPAEPEGSMTPGTYTASAKGQNGDVTVEVTVDKASIVDVKVVAHTETYGVGYGLSTSPIETVPAAMVAAQSLLVDTVTNATVTSVAIRSAVTDCIRQAGGDPADFRTPVEHDTSDETYTTDILVLGAGAAGLAAALSAQEAGVDVLVMEKGGVTGGSTARSGGKVLAAGTQWQEAQGYEDNADMMYDFLMSFDRDGLMNPDLVKQFCDGSLENIMWLDSYGVPFINVEYIHSSITPYRVHNVKGGGGQTSGHGGQITTPLTNAFEGNGGKIIYNTAATKLLTDANGKVIGAVGEKAHGGTVTITANNVILCTGGFGQNWEMLSERYGSFLTGVGSSIPSTNQGDGLKMATAVGAKITENPGMQLVHVNYDCYIGINEESGLIVDQKGERFVDEYTYQSHVSSALARLGEQVMYYITATKDGVCAEPYYMVQMGVNLPSYNFSYKASSLEELAGMIYVDPAALTATVERYNELCAKGVDEDWGKPADHLYAVEGDTYYAFPMYPSTSVTFEGLQLNSKAQVLDANDQPIPGLYAAGEVAYGGLFSDEYPCCGMAIGSAVYFGRTAVASIVAEAQKTASASVRGFGGDVTVTIKADAETGDILDVTVEGPDETPSIGGAILGRLANQAKSQGKIDTVSGATVTSAAAQVAYAKALAQATGVTPEKAAVADGTYPVSVVAYGFRGPMNVEVTIADGKIADIEVGENTETAEVFQTVIDNLIPRIKENQSLAVDAIGGASISSGGMIQAVAKAIEAAGGNRADWYTPVEKSTEVVKLEGYDVIVVGLGASGMSSYISAAENGATVFGMETAGKLGGVASTGVAGPMAINPPSQVAANDGKLFVDPEELIEDWLEYCQGDAKEEMVRLMVAQSGLTMDWLIDNWGFRYSTVMPFSHPKMWPAWGMAQGSKIDIITDAVNKATELNENNKYMTELTGNELIFDADGEIVGVRATYYDGTTYEIYGKNVILATGGYLGNTEWTEKYLGGTFVPYAMKQNNGTGITMGLSAGGALYNIDVPAMVHIATVKNLIRTDELTGDEKTVLTSLSLNTDAPIIGINGTISTDPNFDLAYSNWIFGDTFFTLYTEEQLNEIAANGLPRVNAPMLVTQGRLAADTPIEDMAKILSVGTTYGNVVKADSAEALAALTGIPAEALAEATEGMTGTLYAIVGAGHYYSTCGGLDVDENINVLKEDGTPIANLYAVGTDSMGVLFTNKDAYVTYGGAAQGWALTSGRLAGANAAAASK